jgi:hypothetical protein
MLVRQVGTLVRDHCRAPVTITLIALVLTGASVVTWVVPDPPAVELWASTNLVNLRAHPGPAMIASAFVSAGIPDVLLAAALACAVLERRVGWRRMLIVIAAGHVIATLVSEGAVRLAILSHATSRTASHQLDIGISYVTYTAVGAVLLFIPRRFRRIAVVAVASVVLAQLAIAPTMTAWGHLLSFGIGLLFWPMLRTSTSLPARRAIRLSLAALGVLAIAGLATDYAPRHVLRVPLRLATAVESAFHTTGPAPAATP